MSDCDRLTELVGLAFEAACDAEVWPSFLERLADAIDGTTTVLHTDDLTKRHGKVQIAVRTDPMMGREYSDHYSFAAVVLRNDHLVSLLTSCRPARRGPFGGRETGLVHALIPHLRRALQLHHRLLSSEAQAEASMAALDHVRSGVVFLDERGAVVRTNRVADELFGDRDGGLTANHRELRTDRHADTQALRCLVVGAVATSQQQGLRSGGVIRLRRKSGRKPLEVLVAPVAAHSSWGADAQAARALLVLTDPERSAAPTEDQLRLAFSLSPAEARLVKALTDGLDVRGAAARLDLAESTVRTRLKRVFAKTGTNRQAALVRQALTLAPA